MPQVYDELRAVAGAHLGRERTGHTLQATALVHEAYLRLLEQRKLAEADRQHFKALAAMAIRRILVDHARARQAQKRNSGQPRVQLSDEVALTENPGVDFLALDEALRALAEEQPRQAQVVELRFFGGFRAQEVADLLEVGLRTVNEDWSRAREYLRGALTEPPEPGRPPPAAS